MGPYRLETYIEDDMKGEVCLTVKLDELILQYINETGKQPVLLIDGNSFLYWINNQLPNGLLYGGQPRLFVEKIKNVVQELQGLGLSLIFYFEGIAPEESTQRRKSRNEIKIQKIANIFKSMRMNDTVKDTELNNLPLLISVFGRFILRFTCNSIVKISLRNSVIEMSEYAKKNGCFGILSKNTDFILRKGAKYYLSFKKFDIEEKTTLLYDRDSFYKCMTMNYDEIVLLTAFLGHNDFTDSLKFNRELKKTICTHDNTIHSYKNKVKILTGKYNTSLLDNTAAIAKEIFPQNTDFARNLENRIKLCVSLYKNFPSKIQPFHHGEVHCKDILEVAYQNYINCNMLTDVYGIISGLSFENYVILEDMSKPSIMDKFLSLRELTYRLLLSEAPKSRTREIIEWGVWNGKHNESRVIDINSEFSFAIDHPGLLQLWTNQSREMERTRWALFASIISDSLSPEILAHIDMRYVVPLCVCKYLESSINKMETDALLAQCVAVLSVDCRYLETLNPKFNIEVTELSSMFSCGVFHIIFLMSTCGLPLDNAMPWFYFDGKLLQHMYTELESGQPYSYLFRNKVDLEDFLMLKYILSRPDDIISPEVNTWGF